MPQIITKPRTTIKIVPKEGEIEIKLDINITIDGQVSAIAQSNNASVEIQSVEEKEKETDFLVPNFMSGGKLDFGKKI